MRLTILKPLDGCQFERIGDFCVDRDTHEDRPEFHLTLALRDSGTIAVICQEPKSLSTAALSGPSFSTTTSQTIS